MVSILILTKNEARDLPETLASVAWSDDVHVFDADSVDGTLFIAEAAGAHTYTRTFDDFAAQRNAALDTISFKYPWVFLLDADERPTPELSGEIQAAVAGAGASVSAFRLRRRDFLFGRWLKHAQISPFYVRLVRPGQVRYRRSVNEVLEVSGGPDAILDLVHPLDHFPFSKGFAQWLAKHNVYSTLEAELIYSGQDFQQPSWITALFDRNFHTRRIHQKALFYRLPGRPVLKWLYMMVVRGAFLDGGPGVVYSALQAIYEYFIVLKVRELQRGDLTAKDQWRARVPPSPHKSPKIFQRKNLDQDPSQDWPGARRTGCNTKADGDG